MMRDSFSDAVYFHSSYTQLLKYFGSNFFNKGRYKVSLSLYPYFLILTIIIINLNSPFGFLYLFKKLNPFLNNECYKRKRYFN